ncbi:phosphotransferase family protein [Oceanobacillus massiliensis]|uniref:phosphotransferase family protein n=1 Tax=Oceanobacillus massiliensis TaxID=1465765 RepID=UPI00028999FD|nr:phosphotransferase family protein [Oceanobacillus massiliensis]
MIEWLGQVLGIGWKITPAGGLTGDAFVAEKDNRRLFLKRNSSPFLAVLSAEGIVPKLIWTKRMENGDVITAQEWLEGRALKSHEMQHQRVADILHKIHHSTELLHMLLRMGKKPVTSDESLENLYHLISSMGTVGKHEEVQKAVGHLIKLLPTTRNQELVVCHCDINHNNLILTEDGNIFLVDWDNAMIADPVTDFGMLLKWYIPKENWDSWLTRYGVTPSSGLFERMYWYLLHDAIQFLSWHTKRKEPAKAMERLNDLKEINEQITTTILK